jgi:hypothetical protein
MGTVFDPQLLEIHELPNFDLNFSFRTRQKRAQPCSSRSFGSTWFHSPGSAWPTRPVAGELKLPRRPRTIKPLLLNVGSSGMMPGNGLMNDAWLGQTANPPATGRVGHADRVPCMCSGTPGKRESDGGIRACYVPALPCPRIVWKGFTLPMPRQCGVRCSGDRPCRCGW